MTSPRYAAAPRETLRAVALGELTALYHRTSGQTHLVAEPMPDILEALAEKPLDAAALLARFGSTDADAMSARLAELEAIGLIARA